VNNVLAQCTPIANTSINWTSKGKVDRAYKERRREGRDQSFLPPVLPFLDPPPPKKGKAPISCHMQ